MKREMTLEEIKNVELQLLLRFHEICMAQGFRYSLGGGTLIGAIRHKGFIPWDDDIDVYMPRPDHDRFIRFCMENDVPFDVFSHRTNGNYCLLFSKLADRGSEVTNDVGYNRCPMGINIDIFPVDGLGNSKEEALRIYRKTEFKRELLVASQWRHYTRSLTHSILIEPIRLALFAISRFADPAKLTESIEKKVREYPFDECGYAATLASGDRKKEIMPRSIFDRYTEAEFEGHMFKVFEDYDAFLTNIFGDYMTPPPEEKRVTHHTFSAYEKEDRKGGA